MDFFFDNIVFNIQAWITFSILWLHETCYCSHEIIYVVFVYSVTSHPVCGSDFHNAGCDFSRQPSFEVTQTSESEVGVVSAPEGWDSGKYLVVVKVVGKTPNEQFVWRIRNNRGDDACGHKVCVWENMAALCRGTL